MIVSENILITGASGFIGSSIIRELRKESHSYLPLFRQDLDRVILQPDKFLETNSSIIHCAGRAHIFKETSLSPLDEFQKVNTELTLAIAKAALGIKIKKFIFFSSLSVFGRFTGGHIKDNQTPCADDPYGISKLKTEKKLIELFSNQTHSQCIIFRLPMVYGPGNKGNMLPLLRAALKGIPLPLASAKGKRSMIFVKNVCDAILKVLKDDSPGRSPVQTYFLNDGHDLTSGELYSLISKGCSGKKGIFYFPEALLRYGGILGSGFESIFGKQLPLNKTVISRLFDEYRFSSEAFCRDYDWKPPYTPEEGIRETVFWYKEERRRKVDGAQ
jgi:nucleoside-diphosphate-sugar epimerase